MNPNSSNNNMNTNVSVSTNFVSLITHILSAIGAINWGLIGVADLNLVTTLFGEGNLTKAVYILVGISGIWSLMCASKFAMCCNVEKKPKA